MENLSLWQLIKEDFLLPYQNDPALNSKFEIFFNYPGVWAVINYRISNRLYKRGFKLLARILMGLTQFFTNIDIHPSCKIGRRLFIDHGFGVVIGETAEIGDDVLIYQGVTLGGVSLSKGKRHPTIEDNVVIGAGAKILGNIRVCKNSKIGANSVVIKNVPENSTAVGVPAKVIIKGMNKDKFESNKLPDIDKEMFEYLIKRVAILEQAIISGDTNIIDKDKQLDEIYKAYLNSVKD